MLGGSNAAGSQGRGSSAHPGGARLSRRFQTLWSEVLENVGCGPYLARMMTNYWSAVVWSLETNPSTNFGGPYGSPWLHMGNRASWVGALPGSHQRSQVSVSGPSWMPLSSSAALHGRVRRGLAWFGVVWLVVSAQGQSYSTTTVGFNSFILPPPRHKPFQKKSTQIALAPQNKMC